MGTLEGAIALAETRDVDGALLDVRLRRGQWVHPVAEILRQRRIPSFMTAFNDTQIDQVPAEVVLRKPISIAALERAVRVLLTLRTKARSDEPNVGALLTFQRNV